MHQEASSVLVSGATLQEQIYTLQALGLGVATGRNLI